MSGMLFAHSRWDALLVLVSVLQVALTVWTVWAFPALHWSVLLGLGAALVFLACTNYQCVAHNHIHNPFFRARPLNAAFSAFNSLGLGIPATLYRFHHLNHHQFNNDAIDPATGVTEDRSSTWRHGRGGREEGIVPYAVLGIVRTDLGWLHAQARGKGLGVQVWSEAATLLLFAGALTAVNWRGAVAFYLPAWFLGQVTAFAENYLEHHGAVPGNRHRDSVSSYGGLYNLIWFNNGYHQEHHLRPQVHWIGIRAVRTEMLPDAERKVVRGAHWFNLRGAFFQTSRTTSPPSSPLGANSAVDGLAPPDGR